PDKAFIDPEKLRDYLLSTDHPVGRFKARFFRSLGFSRDHWEELESALRDFVSLDAEFIDENEYGVKYTIRGTLAGPMGASASTVTVWFIRRGEDFPRFVTAYPGN